MYRLERSFKWDNYDTLKCWIYTDFRVNVS